VFLSATDIRQFTDDTHVTHRSTVSEDRRRERTSVDT